MEPAVLRERGVLGVPGVEFSGPNGDLEARYWSKTSEYLNKLAKNRFIMSQTIRMAIKIHIKTYMFIFEGAGAS